MRHIDRGLNSRSFPAIYASKPALHKEFESVNAQARNAAFNASAKGLIAWLINANNQLTQWGDASGTNPAQPRVTQTYDANGHLLTKTVTPEDRSQATTTSQRYRYNLAERLIQVADSSQAEIARYSYDPFGRRIRKTVSQTNSQASGQGTPLGTITYLYADEGLLVEADTSGNITTTYGWIPNGIWGTAPQWKADVTLGNAGNSSPATLTYHYFHNDHLGTSQRLTNDQGVLTWSARMEAFGKTTTIDSIITNLVNGQSQTALMPTTTVNNLRFPGQIEDQETGTFYNYYRDYQASTGRYLQSDPIGLMGGVNWYAYVRGDPMSYIDPYGLALCTTSLPGMNNPLIDDEFLRYVNQWRALNEQEGISLTFNEAFRSQEQQARMNRNPRAITPAAPGDSWHEAGRAVDVNISRFSAEDQARIVANANAIGLRWGGSLSKPDRPHFDLNRGNKTERISQAQTEFSSVGPRPKCP